MMADLRFPTDDDLLAWNLFMMLDTFPQDEVDPPLIKGLIDLHRGMPRSQVHRHLYQNYKEYREQFVE